MAYSGSTAASSVANPPRLASVPPLGALRGTTGLTTAPSVPGGQGGALWTYSSTNLTTDLTAAGFVSDGKALGMRPGDFLLASQFSSAGSSVQTFLGVVTGITTAGAATISGIITSTFS